MFFDFTVEIPVVKGKIIRKMRADTTYVNYEYDRVYLPEKQYTIPKRTTIGKVCDEDSSRMYPNANYLKFFPDAETPKEDTRDGRSPYLNIGAYVVLHELIRECDLEKMLCSCMDERDAGFLLDLACYSIVTENNAGQYYPDYAYCHPLFTPDMKIYSDSRVSDFFHALKPEQTVGFLNKWNASRSKRQRIYISYDSTNKSCQAGDIDMAEYGKAKVDDGQPIFNYSVTYDVKNREPLFYELYPGSINDVSQLTCMVDKAHSYGYRNIGFILDRGYFSRKNLAYMEQNGYAFLIMVKGMKDFISDIVLKKQGSFENRRAKYIERFDVYGTSSEQYLYEGDEKERHIHIYYSDERACGEKRDIKQKIQRYKAYLRKCIGKECEDPGPEIRKYFYLNYEKDGKTLKLAEENTGVIERELSLAGYFAIVSSDGMSAREALELYKGRDASEKLFRSDKSYLGNKSMRVYSDDALSAKVFVQFISLILRSRIYTALKDKCERMMKNPNYTLDAASSEAAPRGVIREGGFSERSATRCEAAMSESERAASADCSELMTVPAAIKELEKIVMIRQLDGVYRLDHAVSATQKTILDAFGLNEGSVRYRAREISKTLTQTAQVKEESEDGEDAQEQ